MTLEEKLEALALVQREQYARRGEPVPHLTLFDDLAEGDDVLIARAARQGRCIAHTTIVRLIAPDGRAIRAPSHLNHVWGLS